MRRNTIFTMVICLLIILNIKVNAQGTEKERIAEVTTQITNLLKVGMTDSSIVIISDVVDVDSMVGNSDTYFGQLQDPYGTLKECFIFIAEIPQAIGYRSEVGVYKSNNILWNSGPISEGTLGRIFATMDLTNTGKTDIIATWLTGATGAYSEMWIFSWDGRKGTTINSYDDLGSKIYGNSGSFQIEDIDGSGKYVITCQLDTEEVEYAWNGTTFHSIINPPVLVNNTFSPANNFNMFVSAKVETTSEGYEYNYTVTNKQISKQSINNIMIVSCLDSIQNFAPKNWRSLLVKNESLARFVAEYDYKGIISPGNSLKGFRIISRCLPGISKYYAQAPHNSPVYKPQEVLLHVSEYTNDFLNNSVTGFTIGPVKLSSTFDPIYFLDTLISFKHQAFSLGWIDNQGIVNSLNSKLDNAKKKLAAGDSSAAFNILNAFVNEVEAQKGKHLSSEAYALLKYNADYLISRLK